MEGVVVDNGSRDATREIAEASPVVDRVIRRDRGESPGAARNAGARSATAPVLAFLDADCVAAADWLARGTKALTGGADLVQGAVEPDPQAPRGAYDRT